jgi:cation diffusion facilitator CzcD-associated flavoprotein CzcO
VVGAGQSALEGAALLRQAAAEVEVVLRAPSIVWLASEESDGGLGDRYRKLMAPPTDVGGKAGWIAAAPDLFRLQPPRARAFIARRCTVPAGGSWLRAPLEDVPQTVGRTVMSAEAGQDGIKVALDDGSERSVDHVVLGTGFRVDVASYPFLSECLLSGLEVSDGFPVLGPGLESSVPGLHFTGAPAALSFGPIMRFVVGTWYAAPALTEGVTGRRRRPIRFSYPPRLATWLRRRRRRAR